MSLRHVLLFFALGVFTGYLLRANGEDEEGEDEPA